MIRFHWLDSCRKDYMNTWSDSIEQGSLSYSLSSVMSAQYKYTERGLFSNARVNNYLVYIFVIK